MCRVSGWVCFIFLFFLGGLHGGGCATDHNTHIAHAAAYARAPPACRHAASLMWRLSRNRALIEPGHRALIESAVAAEPSWSSNRALMEP